MQERLTNDARTYLVDDWYPQFLGVEEPVPGAGHHHSETLDGDIPAVLLGRRQPDSREVYQLQLKTNETHAFV